MIGTYVNLNNDAYLDDIYGDHYGYQIPDHDYFEDDTEDFEAMAQEDTIMSSEESSVMDTIEADAKSHEAYRAYTKEDMIMTTTTNTMGATINATTTVDTLPLVNKEVTMKTMKKEDIRLAIEAVDERFVMSNKAYAKIKKEVLIDLLEVSHAIVKLMADSAVQFSFDTYVELAKKGNVPMLVDVTFTDASAASITSQASAPEVEASAPIKEEVLMKETAEQKIARLEAEVLELEAKLVLARTIYKEMNAELKGYRAAAVVPVVAPVVLAPPVVTPAVKGQGRYTKEEMEAMRLRAMNGTHVVVASNDVVTGAYTKAEVQIMKQAANRTAELCSCGTHLTKQNLNYLSQAKVQAAMPVPYKGVSLCFHCHQAVLGGGVPFTAEQRKAGVHKSVKRVVIK